MLPLRYGLKRFPVVDSNSSENPFPQTVNIYLESLKMF